MIVVTINGIVMIVLGILLILWQKNISLKIKYHEESVERIPLA